MRRSGKKTSSKIDLYILITMLAGLITLAFRILLGYMMDDNGLAYFAAANELFAAVGGMLAYGLSEAMAILVRYRVRREQYKSAGKLLRSALFLGTAAGLVGTVLFALLGDGIAEAVLGLPNAGMAVRMMSPAILFMTLTGVFRGYFRGYGSKVLSMHSQLLYAVLLTAGGLVGTELMHGYGEKVSALLRNDDFTNAYSALGAAAGILTASFFCFLHTVVIAFLSRNAMGSGKIGREPQKNLDTPFRLLQILAGTGGAYVLYWILLFGKNLVDQLCFFHVPGSGEGRIGQWGIYYGKYMPVCGILAGIFSLIGLLQVRRVASLAEREDRRYANEKLAALIHQCAVNCIPAAVLLAVLSENIAGILFKGSNTQLVGWIQWGSLVVAFCPFTVVFTGMLSRGRKQKMIGVIFFGALVLHTGLAALLLTLGMGITALILASALFYLVTAGAEFWLIARTYQYRQEWIRTFAVTVVAAAIAGVIAMLLNMAFHPMLGNALALLIALLVAIPAYVILLLVTRAFKETELLEMPGGGLLIRVGQMLHFM